MNAKGILNTEVNAAIQAYQCLCHHANLYKRHKPIYDKYMKLIRDMKSLLIKINPNIKFNGIAIVKGII